MKKLFCLLLSALAALLPVARAENDLNEAFWENLWETVAGYDPRSQALTVDFGGVMFSYQPGEDLAELSAHLGEEEYAVQLGEGSLWLKLGGDDVVFEAPFAALVGALGARAEEIDGEALSQIGMMFATIALMPGFSLAQTEEGWHIGYERELDAFLTDCITFGDTVMGVERYQIALNALLPDGTTAETCWTGLREALANAGANAEGGVTADIDVQTLDGLRVDATGRIVTGADEVTFSAVLTGRGDGYAAALTMTDQNDEGLRVEGGATLDEALQVNCALSLLTPEEMPYATLDAALADGVLSARAETIEGFTYEITCAYAEEGFALSLTESADETPVTAFAVQAQSAGENGAELSAYLLLDDEEWIFAANDDAGAMNANAVWPGASVNARFDYGTESAPSAQLLYSDFENEENSFTVEWDGKAIVFTDGSSTVRVTGEAQSESFYVLTAAYSGAGVTSGEYQIFLELTEQENGWVLSVSDAQAAYAVISCAEANIIPLKNMNPTVLTLDTLTALVEALMTE